MTTCLNKYGARQGTTQETSASIYGRTHAPRGLCLRTPHPSPVLCPGHPAAQQPFPARPRSRFQGSRVPVLRALQGVSYGVLLPAWVPVNYARSPAEDSWLPGPRVGPSHPFLAHCPVEDPGRCPLRSRSGGSRRIDGLVRSAAPCTPGGHGDGRAPGTLASALLLGGCVL